VPRNQDRALWEEFRRHCDAIFERSAQESAAYGAALEANHARAIAMCEELERSAGLSVAATRAAAPPLGGLRAEIDDIRGRADDPRTGANGLRVELDDLRTKFDALELPRAAERGLRQRFRRAAERFAEALQHEWAAAARRGWTDALVAAAQVRAYALAVTEGRPADECEALRSAAASTIAGLEYAPRSARAALDAQLARTAAGEFDADLVANEAALRLLCVRAELVAGLPTPPEDEELRREYQMQRLVASLGRGERARTGDLDELALEWIAVGPVEAATHDALLERFGRCRHLV
jgi:hypothetical protein